MSGTVASGCTEEDFRIGCHAALLVASKGACAASRVCCLATVGRGPCGATKGQGRQKVRTDGPSRARGRGNGIVISRCGLRRTGQGVLGTATPTPAALTAGGKGLGLRRGSSPSLSAAWS